MYITILGCRGSYPVSYPEAIRYGGDTTCIQVVADGHFIVFDAGTGIRHMAEVPDYVNDVHLFISHLHWDHIIGFPLWPLLNSRPDLTVHIYSLARSHDRFYGALLQSLSRPLSNHDLEEMVVNFRFYELQPGQGVEIGQRVLVRCALANHPYKALAFRVDETGAGALTFVPDTSPFDRYLFNDDIVFKDTRLLPHERDLLMQRQEAVIRLASEADWLIYDAAQTDAEYEKLPHWGHSTMSQAAQMGRWAGVRELIMFHHNPNRTDTAIDAMLNAAQLAHPDLNISAAYAGMQRGLKGGR